MLYEPIDDLNIPNTQKVKPQRHRNILELSCIEARNLFLKTESYCNFDLPFYIDFKPMLSEVSQILMGKVISAFYRKGDNPGNHEGLNHIILNNKDGKYAWRRQQLINPALYVSLAHQITEQSHWETIKKKFEEYSANKRIMCCSLPLESSTSEKDKAERVTNWWHSVEQESISLSLEYEYLLQTDITDCYGSIYTHSIAWALHGKSRAKNNKDSCDLIGNLIDKSLQGMSNRQTNGIPQGSILMDFIAEMVLGYADLELSVKIENSGIKDFYIIRYRDDYRIFVNNPQDGERILKHITEVLFDLGLQLNPLKTSISNQIIRDSIKKDKLYWICQKQNKGPLQKQLLMIHELAMRYPNSGSINKALAECNNNIIAKKDIKNTRSLISIIIDIAYHNPKTYPVTIAILSKFIDSINEAGFKNDIINKILNRFNKIPYTGHLEIWLQRITNTFNYQNRYIEPICNLIDGNSQSIWNLSWLSSDFEEIIDPKKIVDQTKLVESRRRPIISNEEVALFRISEY